MHKLVSLAGLAGVCMLAGSGIALAHPCPPTAPGGDQSPVQQLAPQVQQHAPQKTTTTWRVWYRTGGAGKWGPWIVEGDYSTEAEAYRHAMKLNKEGRGNTQATVQDASAPSPRS